MTCFCFGSAGDCLRVVFLQMKTKLKKKKPTWKPERWLSSLRRASSPHPTTVILEHKMYFWQKALDGSQTTRQITHKSPVTIVYSNPRRRCGETLREWSSRGAHDSHDKKAQREMFRSFAALVYWHRSAGKLDCRFFECLICNKKNRRINSNLLQHMVQIAFGLTSFS